MNSGRSVVQQTVVGMVIFAILLALLTRSILVGSRLPSAATRARSLDTGERSSISIAYRTCRSKAQRCR